MLKVYIEPNVIFAHEVKYIWSVYSRDQGIPFILVNSADVSDISIGVSDSCGIVLNEDVYGLLLKGEHCNDIFIGSKGLFFNKKGVPDYLTTAFYVLSCAQEMGVKERDHYGRYPFQASFQAKLNTVGVDIVSDCFLKLTNSHALLGQTSKISKIKSRIFLSHDIDLLNGALYQDGYFCLRNRMYYSFFKVLITNIFNKPSWQNIGDIINLERHYGCTSTFFWLPVQGMSKYGVKNADYNIKDIAIQSMLDEIDYANFSNGLHKSISELSIEDEIERLGRKVYCNRYHFLAMDPHQDLLLMEAAGIKFDSSISFAEMPSFRAGYSKPYKPYIFSERRAAELVECPMHLMDTTFFNYLNYNAEEAYSYIVNFINDHSINAVISILWHNNYITDYKYRSYKDLYIRLLKYLHDNSYECVAPGQIIKEFGV